MINQPQLILYLKYFHFFMLNSGTIYESRNNIAIKCRVKDVFWLLIVCKFIGTNTTRVRYGNFISVSAAPDFIFSLIIIDI